MDLTKGGANERVRKIPVRYGTIDRAVGMLSKGAFIFVIDFADCFWHWRLTEDNSWEMGFHDDHSDQFGKFDYWREGVPPVTSWQRARVCVWGQES